MFNETSLKAALHHLSSLVDYQSFYEHYTKTQEISSSNDLFKFLDELKSHLVAIEKWNDELELTLKLIKEQSYIIKHNKSSSPLFSIDQSKKINDTWLTDFEIELKQCLTGDTSTEDIKPRRYKTITEKRWLFELNIAKSNQVYHKYSHFNHPLVNYYFSDILFNSKKFNEGLPILKEGIRSVCSYPIHYWNNEAGIEGATWLIGDLLYLLGNKLPNANLISIKIRLLKLFFLYASRYICMTESNYKSIDFYSNRARIVKGNFFDFIGIFGLGVNPDIQYMSDTYLAYFVAQKFSLSSIPMFEQLLWDSLKMYEHGSHIPNTSGGYKEIEEKTWGELVKIGEIRSLVLANKLLKEFENYELNISNPEINIIFAYLTEKKFM